MTDDSQTSSLSRELTVLLPETDTEQTLNILKDYVSKLENVTVLTDSEIPILPSEVSDVFCQISEDAHILYPWKYLYTVLIIKFKEVLNTFDEVTADRREEQTSMLEHIDSLLVHRFKQAPPFTIQRICDLLSEPKKFYKSKLKYIRAFEKVLTVISLAKVHCRSPTRLSSASPDSKFSPPAKRIKHEVSTASTVIFSSDSTSSSERNSIVLPLTSSTEVSLPLEPKKSEKEILELSDTPSGCEQDTECSVSEADSTTLNGLRNEGEGEEVTCGKLGTSPTDKPETSQLMPADKDREKSI